MISNGKDTSLKQVEAEVSTKSTSITPTKNELSNSTSKPTPTNDKSTEQTKEQLVVNEKEKKKQAFVTRTIWTFVMIGGFFAILASGHLALIIMVSVFQMLTFKEVIALTSEPARDKKIPWNRSLNWYFLGTTWYYLDFPALFDFFQDSVYSSKFLTLLVKNHKFISYSLYIAGFVFFVWTSYDIIIGSFPSSFDY